MSHPNHFWLRIVVALLTFSASAWSETPPYVQSDSGDAAGVRMVANRLFDAYAKKDLEGIASLWSAKSPSLESRRKALATLFAGVGPIELASLTVRDVSIEGEKARIRVTAEMKGVDAKTGKEAAGLGTVNRSLHLVKEDGIWRIWNDLSSEEELANALAEAKTDQERGRLLTAEKYLVDIELRKALLVLGNNQRVQSKFTEALATYKMARDIAEQIRDKAGVVIATNFIGVVQGQMGDFAAALRTFQKVLELAEEIGSKIQMEAALNNIGILYRQQGNYASAMQYYQKAIPIAETLEDKSSMARTLNNLGTVYLKQGNYRQAMECLEKSLALKQALGDVADIPAGLLNIGDVYFETDEYSKAADYYERAVALNEKAGNKIGLSLALKALGDIRFVRQDYTAAADYYQKSLDLYESMRSKFGIADSLDKLAFVSLKQRDFRKALELAGRVASIAREEGLREQLWSALTTTGSAYQAMGRTEQARSAFNEAIDDIEAIRADVAGGAQSQSDFFQNRLSPYQSMVELLVGQHEFEASLTYAERSKARTLLDVLSSGRINVTKAMTDGQRAVERALNVRLVS